MDSDPSESYTISSTPVIYPHKAYPSQIGMIDRVIKALQRNQNCLIESPTGSGKSLALLCSVLAWRKNEYDRVENDILQMVQAENPIKNSVYSKEFAASKNESPETPIVDLTLDESFSVYDDGERFISSSQLRTSPKKPQSSAETSQSKPLTEDEIRDRIYEARKKIPKIYFGTRTHKQLAQLIRELKKTEYANVKMTILGSRDQTCINDTVRAERDRGEACRKMLNPSTNMLTGTCPFHARWKKNFQKPHLLRGTIRREHQAKRNGEDCGAWDIEDLVEIGREFGFCPYFASSNTLLADAELVFCPYNYLIDPLVRDSVRLDLKEQIIVLDEAHNIEDVCRDASSFSFTHFELTDAEDKFHCASELEKYPPAKSASYLEKVCKGLKDWLNEVVASKTMKMQSHTVQTKDWQGQHFLEVLVRLELTKEDGVKIKEHLEVINAYSDEENGEKPWRPPGDLEFSIISTVALKAMEKLVLFLDYFWKSDARNDYRVCVRYEQQMSQRTQHHHITQGGVVPLPVTLNLWCMNPAMAFGDIGSVAKSVILASGTLAPMKTFETELGVPFKLQLEATHVLPKDRMFIASVSKGPSGRPLRVTYQNSSEWVFQDEIGQVIIDVCTTVPFGVLCFFPSYKLLEALQERWRTTGTWDRLSTRKLIVVEPKMGEELQRTMDKFYKAIENPSSHGLHCTGALFMAVCRGKVSEGLDFADNNARAVITIGIPYPNFSGFEVVQKREYNNDRVRQGKTTLTGDQWYEIQAYRALNQALGRCLRHRQDWGALILVDERFGKEPKRYCSNLSRWIRENINHYDDFGKARSGLEQFTERLLATQETEKNRIPLQGKRQLSSNATTSPSSTPAVQGASTPSALFPYPPASYSKTKPLVSTPSSVQTPFTAPNTFHQTTLAGTPNSFRRTSTLSTPTPLATSSTVGRLTPITPLVQPRKTAFEFRRNGQSSASPYFDRDEEQSSSASSKLVTFSDWKN